MSKEAEKPTAQSSPLKARPRVVGQVSTRLWVSSPAKNHQCLVDTPTIKQVAEHLTGKLRLWVQLLAPLRLTTSTRVMTVDEVLDFLSESFLDSFLLPK